MGSEKKPLRGRDQSRTPCEDNYSTVQKAKSCIISGTPGARGLLPAPPLKTPSLAPASVASAVQPPPPESPAAHTAGRHRALSGRPGKVTTANLPLKPSPHGRSWAEPRQNLPVTGSILSPRPHLPSQFRRVTSVRLAHSTGIAAAAPSARPRPAPPPRPRRPQARRAARRSPPRPVPPSPRPPPSQPPPAGCPPTRLSPPPQPASPPHPRLLPSEHLCRPTPSPHPPQPPLPRRPPPSPPPPAARGPGGRDGAGEGRPPRGPLSAGFATPPTRRAPQRPQPSPPARRKRGGGASGAPPTRLFTF
ncbi:basic proline-rich protein-like [Dipodomys merriami]|uniref:basic proline-rich protein-like n=1 Tax=Dipodomys merriami TaxID=94247 RepID=UPI0038559CCD